MIRVVHFRNQRASRTSRVATRLHTIDTVSVTTMTLIVNGIGSLPTGVSDRISFTPANASNTARP